MTRAAESRDALTLPSAEQFADIPEAQAIVDARLLLDRLKERVSADRAKVDVLTARLDRPLRERESEAVGALLADPFADLREENVVNRRALAEAIEDLRIAERAVVVQEQAISDRVVKYSRVVCRQLEPQHRALVRAIANAITALAVASRDEQRFRAALRDEGVRVSFPPMVYSHIGLLTDVNSAVRMYLTECRRHEFITEPELAALIQGGNLT